MVLIIKILVNFAYYLHFFFFLRGSIPDIIKVSISYAVSDIIIIRYHCYSQSIFPWLMRNACIMSISYRLWDLTKGTGLGVLSLKLGFAFPQLCTKLVSWEDYIKKISSKRNRKFEGLKSKQCKKVTINTASKLILKSKKIQIIICYNFLDRLNF